VRAYSILLLVILVVGSVHYAFSNDLIKWPPWDNDNDGNDCQYTNQQDCEGAGCYWYDSLCHSEPYSPPPPPPEDEFVVISSFTVTEKYIQGVATDGTYIYVLCNGGGGGIGVLLKYSKTGTLVMSNMNMPEVEHPSDIAYKDGKIFVCDMEGWSSYNHASAKTKVVTYDAATLQYVQSHPNLADHWGEGIVWYQGSWWLSFHCCSILRKYDGNWGFQKQYDIEGHGGTEATWSPGNGYQGIAFWRHNSKTYLGATVHRSVVGGPAFHIFEYTSDRFSLEKTVTTGPFIPNQGWCTNSDGSSAWLADRATSTRGVVANCRVDVLSPN